MRELTVLDFKTYDALHLACAEGNADVFLTTDDRLLRKSLIYQDRLKILVANPLTWLLEIDQTLGDSKMTPVELTRKGFKALVDSLGYVDAVKFIRQFDQGSGDYTQERHQWLEQLTTDEILAEINQRQNHEIPE